jgi:hypothetical protein
MSAVVMAKEGGSLGAA